MYKVIGHPNSRAVRVMWALEEIGADYEIVVASPHSEEIFKHNPGGKVPALVDGDTTLTDSVAIITYLADKHGALTAPAGTAQRGMQDSLTQFACDELDQPLWTAAKARFALPEAYRVPDIKKASKFEWARACKTLEARLGSGSFAMGETLTVPDIIIGHCAGWALSAKFDWPGGPVGAYFERMQAHPALEKARAKGKAALPAET